MIRVSRLSRPYRQGRIRDRTRRMREEPELLAPPAPPLRVVTSGRSARSTKRRKQIHKTKSDIGFDVSFSQGENWKGSMGGEIQKTKDVDIATNRCTRYGAPRIVKASSLSDRVSSSFLPHDSLKFFALQSRNFPSRAHDISALTFAASLEDPLMSHRFLDRDFAFRDLSFQGSTFSPQ